MRRWRTASISEFVADLRGFDWTELRYVSACGYWPFAVYAVICAGSVVLVLLSSLALLPGLNASWQDVQEQSVALERERTALRLQLDTDSARHISLTHQCAHCAALHRQLRPADPMPVVLDRLRNAAALRGIVISALRPEKTWQQLSVKAFEIAIQMRADRRQVAEFLGDIGALPFAFAIKQAEFHMASSQGRLTLFLLVDDNGRVQDSNVIAVTNPAGAQVDSAPDAGIARWQRVAFIQRGNRFLEVLRDNRGETRRRAGEMVEVAQ